MDTFLLAFRLFRSARMISNTLEKANSYAWTCIFLGGDGLNLNSWIPGHRGQHCSRHAQSHCGGHKHKGAWFSSISLVGMLVHGCCLQRKLSIWNQPIVLGKPLIGVVGDGCHGTFLTLNLVDGANTLVWLMIILFEIWNFLCVANAMQ